MASALRPSVFAPDDKRVSHSKDPYAQETSLRNLSFAELSRRRTASQVLESHELLMWHANMDNATIPATRFKFWKIMVGWESRVGERAEGGSSSATQKNRVKEVKLGVEWKGPRPVVDTVEILKRRRDDVIKEQKRKRKEMEDLMDIKEEQGTMDMDEDDNGGVSLQAVMGDVS